MSDILLLPRSMKLMFSAFKKNALIFFATYCAKDSQGFGISRGPIAFFDELNILQKTLMRGMNVFSPQSGL
jgi:hypothetical protein